MNTKGRKVVEESLQAKNDRALQYSMKTGYSILKMIGGWPLDENATTFGQIVYHLKKFLCYFFFVFILVPGFLRIFLVERNNRRKLKILGPLCTCSMNTIKYSLLMKHSENIRACMRHVREDWRRIRLQRDHDTMLLHAKIGRTLAVLSASFIYGAGLFYRTILPLSKGNVVINNVTIKPHPGPAYFVFFNDQKSPAYEMVFVAQFIGGFIVYSVACGVCGMASFFVMHMCGQLEILDKMIDDMNEPKRLTKKEAAGRITEIVQRHIRIRSFVKQVEEVIEFMCMGEIISCTSLVCLVLYYVIMEWEDSDVTGLITYFLLLTSFAFNMFIFCYVGELLSDQGMKVGISSRCLEWHRLPTESAKSVVLVVLISSDPIKIVAGKMMVMSLSNFNNIIKTAVGYFNILRTTV